MKHLARLLTAAAGLSAFAAPAFAAPEDAHDKDLRHPSSEGGRQQDRKESLRATIDEVSQKKFLHGFRLGYLYVANIHTSINPNDPNAPTLASKYGIRSPHEFLIGYELTWRLVGHEWLNILLVTNAMVAGLEQSKVFPSMNGLVGFELGEVLQLGVGVNAVPTADKPAHMILAAGWTPRVGDFYTPIHFFFIPDVDGQHRMGATLGVNW